MSPGDGAAPAGAAFSHFAAASFRTDQSLPIPSGGPTAAISASTRYSPLDQINAGNFNKLEVAWRFKTDNLGPRPEFNFQSTPLMVGGVLYTTAGSRAPSSRSMPRLAR